MENATTSNAASPEKLHRRHRVFQSYKAKADARRTGAERFADWVTSKLGTVSFLAGNAIVFLVWIVLNLGWIPGLPAFDPFPYGLLTMLVSLEAIFLSIIVLISQNRAALVADLREEIELQIDLIAEKEITKIMKLLEALSEKNGIDLSGDQELQEMIQPIHNEEIEKNIEKQLS